MSNLYARWFSMSLASALTWGMAASTSLAHPDHPVQVGLSDSLLHYFVQPEHALPLGVFAVAMWLISRSVRFSSLARVPAKKSIQVEDRR